MQVSKVIIMTILNIHVYITNILITTILLIRGLLFSVSVPIIPVYLDIIEKPRGGVSLSADNSTKNSTFTTASSLVTTDSSMDFKIGALFASKAFVQVW